MKIQAIRIAMLHLAFKHDNVTYNVELLERLFVKALPFKPNLVVMPELAVSGYEFFRQIGKEWIRDKVSPIVETFSRLARENKVAIVLSSPRYNAERDRYYNAAIFIDERGQVLGEYYKINVLPGSEAWSSPGFAIKPIIWNGHKIGLLICSDAYTDNIVRELVAQGANVLISPAAWAPGMHAPNGEWEQRSQETGLCMYICNRTGKEDKLNFEGSASAIIAGGRRLCEYSGRRPAILTIDVDPANWYPREDTFRVFEF